MRYTDAQALALARKAGLIPSCSYPGHKVPWEGKCASCGRDVSPQFGNLVNGQGPCRPCGQQRSVSARRLSETQAMERALQMGFTPSEPFRGVTSPWKGACNSCGQEVSPRLDRGKRMGPCRRCGIQKTVATKKARSRGNKYKKSDGYVLVRIPEHPNASNKGYVPEHRYVMSQLLGRPLLSHENVHHINGVKDDNRIENLELWSTMQPSGQRVADKTQWAKEWLARYEPLSLTRRVREELRGDAK